MGTHWASHAIEALARGEVCKVTPHGNSMRPRIQSGATVTLSPLQPDEPHVGDAVLVKVRGTVYLHLVKATRKNGDSVEVQIGNASGHVNGWASRAAVYGKATLVENP